MNKYVEALKDNRVLDIIKARGTLEDIPTGNLEDYMVVVTGDFDYIGQIVVGKYRLVIVWGGDYSNRLNDGHPETMGGDRSTDMRMRNYIHNNVEKAFVQSVDRYDDYIYVLNIATYECFGNFAWGVGWSKELLNQQLNTFMPIIQKFMADALTDSLKV